VFREFSQLVHARLPSLYELPSEKRYIGQLPAGYLLTRRGEDASFEEPFSQVALQNLHDLGVRDIVLNPEDGTANVRESEHTDCSLGRASWIDHSTVSSGRAYIAALNDILHRKFKLNDAEVVVGMQTMEVLKQARSTLAKEKVENESMLFTTARVMGSLLRRRMGIETTEMRCLIELASGMGLVAVKIDPEKNEILFRGFSEMAALSTALLHGAQWDTLKKIRRQVQQMAAQTGQVGTVGSGTAAYDPTSVKRRRRD
jgi:hypothetical protein